ncbi:MAG: hypothetical protein AAFV88_04210 [Planctomycetota bacterium]
MMVSMIKRLMVCAAVALWLGMACPCAVAQLPASGDAAAVETKKRSALQKLDQFQQSVKLRLKRALGVKTNEIVAPPESTLERSLGGRSPYQQTGAGADDLNTVRPVRIASQHDWHQQTASSGQSDPYYANPNSNSNANQVRTVASNTDPNVWQAQASQPLPPPMRDVPTEQLIPRRPPPVVRSNPQVPFAQGTVLGQSPVTATEHALRLIQENGDLKAQLAVSEAQAERLREKLMETQALLAQSSDAVQAAKDEIDSLVDSNRRLERKLSDAELKYNRYLAETDRMLQAIREELDDVLVREISSKGN